MDCPYRTHTSFAMAHVICPCVRDMHEYLMDVRQSRIEMLNRIQVSCERVHLGLYTQSVVNSENIGAPFNYEME